MRTFVVGDIHGHLSLLKRLMPLLQEEAEPGDSLVFVGDYVDRGPEARGVVDCILELRAGGWKGLAGDGGQVVALKGNHEDLMLDWISLNPRFDPGVWLQNGGMDTILSYATGELTPNWAAAIPAEHRAFFDDLLLYWEDERGIYVHAGLKPGQRPEELTPEVALWIRDEFIDSDFRWEKVVVFGHTPQYSRPARPVLDRSELPWRVLELPEKLGIDTGAAYGGPLSAVILPERRIVDTR